MEAPPGGLHSNQPTPPQSEGGQESHEVMKELMAVKQELAKVNAELLIHRNSTEELAKVKAKMEEQERKSKELALQVEGLGNAIAVRDKQSNQQPSTNAVGTNMTFQLTEEGDASPKLDKKGIVRGGQEVYSFNESVWDSLVFLGHIQGSYEGVDMLILGLLNLLIQLFFCILLLTLDLADTGMEVHMERVNAFIQWRIGVAHQAEHYDPLTNSSLAQRVCFQYGGTVTSRRHQNDLQVATSYYDLSRNQFSELQGPGLLMLALALWMALILKEVISILGFIRMLVALAFNGDGTTDLRKERFSDRLEMRSMSTRRAWLVLITVVVPRLFIALLLGYVGIFYLRQTFSVEEIILNAMALGFVLEIDELLFHFLPAAARYLVTHINSVPLAIKLSKLKRRDGKSDGAWRSRKIVGAILERSRVLLVILVVVVICFRFTIIAQIQDSMEMSQVLLCEGNRHFIFKESRATKVMHLAQTVDKSHEDDMDLPIDEIQDAFDAILQATNLCNILAEKQDLQERLDICNEDNPEQGMWCKRCPYVLSLGSENPLWKDDSLEHTISLVTATHNEALSSLACEDRYTSLSETFIPAPMNELLLQAGANFSAGLCRDLEQYCLDPNMKIREVIRIFCPRECRCDHGTVSTIDTWFFDRSGCAPTCQNLVHAELTELEDDLVLGKETCVDHDTGLTEEQWRPYVEDVERELVKRGWLDRDGGLLYASETIRGFFAVRTEKDVKKFVSTVLHPSNQPTVTVDGCTMPNMPVDLAAWARQAGSLCRWARIVKYVFGLNLCSHDILLSEGFYGFNALSGLCPLSCGISSCSQVRPEGEMDFNLDAWYNVMPWGQESHYNFECDTKNLVCLEVEKFARERFKWHPEWKITISEDFFPGKTVYSAGLLSETLTLAHEKDVICMRPPAGSSSCYRIDTQMVLSLYHGAKARLRWRLSEVGTGQFLLMGAHNEMHRACGLHWLSDLGVQCKHGDTVSVMTSWRQMQVDKEIVAAEDANAHIPADPRDFSLQGTEHGMLAWRKAVLLGGYNASSVQVLYSLDLMGRMATVPFGSLALPRERASDAGQGFAACLPSPELSELRPDKELCANSDFALTCTRFVSQAHCETPLGFVRELFVTHGCESDLDGFSDDDTVAKLCPEPCAAQATCSAEPRLQLGPRLWYYSEYYYTFRLAGCLDIECECMDPNHMVRTCWTEMNMTTRWNQPGPGYYLSLYSQQLDLPEQDREIGGQLLKDGTYCASEEAGFMSRSFPMANVSDQWCYVRPTCLGSSSSLKNADSCSWRPAYDRECAVDKSNPGFCLWSHGPHSCFTALYR